MKVLFRASALALALAAWAAAGPASAEGYVLYDNFQATALNPARWQDTERSRMSTGSQLRLVQRDWGPTTSDATDEPGISWSETIARGGPVTQLRALMKVVAIDMTGCPNNATPTSVRGRVIGSFFNSGNRVSGSSVGDVIAQVWAVRRSNSADAPGVLRVEGWVGMCTSSDCAKTTQIGATVPLGTVNVGTNVTMQVDWDRPNKQFLFSRDKGVQTGFVSYAGIDDSADPGSIFKNVSTYTRVANCASGPRAYGYIDARFDNVQVNTTAKP